MTKIQRRSDVMATSCAHWEWIPLFWIIPFLLSQSFLQEFFRPSLLVIFLKVRSPLSKGEYETMSYNSYRINIQGHDTNNVPALSNGKNWNFNHFSSVCASYCMLSIIKKINLKICRLQMSMTSSFLQETWPGNKCKFILGLSVFSSW